jgi:hypothetical protein
MPVVRWKPSEVCHDPGHRQDIELKDPEPSTIDLSSRQILENKKAVFGAALEFLRFRIFYHSDPP